MSEPKFTPGPWECVSKKQYEKIARHNQNAFLYIPIVELGDKKIMPQTVSLRWLPEVRKNAHLIAAAPEMYHDLHEAVVEMCHNCPSNTESGVCDKDKCFVQRWRKTLKKARGE